MKYVLRLRCLYCGCDDFSPELRAWELKAKRCRHCNHDKFKVKRMDEGTRNPFGYEEQDASLTESLDDIYGPEYTD